MPNHREPSRKQLKNCLKSNHLEQEWERIVLNGLAFEWDGGLSELPSEVAAELRRPTFRLSDMESRWGYWNGQARQIVLSRKLVLKYAWDSVREILLHEMAHQVAEQAFGSDGRRPHGARFQRACALLKANPAATGSYPPLEERIRSGAVSQRDAVMARVDKLMALAQSSHRHEAEAAMLKAHELIARYNIDHIKNRVERFFVSAFVGKPALRHYQDDYELANLIQDSYFVRGIWVRAFVIEKAKMGRVLEISGTSKNVSIARHVYVVLARTIKDEWQKYRAGNKAPGNARLDFALGIINGFRQKIEGQFEKLTADPEDRALIRVEDQKLENYFEQRYPRTRSISRTARRRHSGIEAAGNEIGRRLTISKAVENNARKSSRLLPGKID